MAGLKKLLFVDTNIWLDFYRARSEAALALLHHLEAIADRIVVTYQLEMEFKKNRQNAILEGISELKPPNQISRPGLFSDAKAVKKMQSSLKTAEVSVRRLRHRFAQALEKPTTKDPVFKVCQRIFHRGDDLVLRRGDKIRHAVRRRAFRRFVLGCPPRKKGDTSIGDAINWEWMVDRAIAKKAELVIVSRDSDYGVTYDGRSIINDHLRQEFTERVSKKRKVLLFAKLSDALKLFSVSVTPQEEEEEKSLITPAVMSAAGAGAVTGVGQSVRAPTLQVLLEELLKVSAQVKSTKDEG
jgi:predicted nucleic acid-binding protein